MEKDTTINSFEVKGKIELDRFDAKEYIGKKVKIDLAVAQEGAFGYYVRVETQPVATLGETSIRASRIFGLHQNKAGEIGWDDNTALGKFLKAMRVDHYNQLPGKEVIVQVKEKGDKEFLTF
jgi:hypothetical protein